MIKAKRVSFKKMPSDSKLFENTKIKLFNGFFRLLKKLEDQSKSALILSFFCS